MASSVNGRGRRIAGSARRSVALAVALVVVVAACGGSTTSPQTSSSPGTLPGGSPATGASGAPAAAPAGKLTVAIDNLGTQQYAPHLASQENEYVMGILGETLTTLNPETRAIEGRLAESWSLSDDLKTWTFKLRPNIPFHDGNGTVTAQDVKYTWSQYIREDATYSVSNVIRQSIDNDLANFEIVNDLEFKLHMTEPIVYLDARLSHMAAGPYIRSQKYQEENPNAGTHPVGTGPFKFVSNSPGVEVVFEAVPDHWRQTPGFKDLVLKEIADPSARLVQTQSGAVDIAHMTADLLNEARSIQGLRIVNVPDAGSALVNFGGTFYGEPQHDDDAPWNQADAPEKALAIRQAMSLAIDRAAIHERLLFGEGDLVHAPLFQYPSNPELVDPAWTLPAFDLALAKQKLVEGGYPNGFPIIFPIYDQKFGTAIVGEAIAGMWEDLGLQVTRQVTDENAFGPKLDARDTDGHVFIYVGGWYPETAIRLNLLQPVREDALFVDPVSTETFQKLNAEPDKAKRYALARELASHFITEMRAIPLFTMGIPYVVGPRVATWTPVPSWDQISGLETATP